MKNMTAKEFLIGKGILDMGLSKWIVTFSNGRILDIVELMEEYRNKSRWISVKESGLPKQETNYWICTDKRITSTRFFNGVRFELAEYEGNVTHYQPLPEIPTE